MERDYDQTVLNIVLDKEEGDKLERVFREMNPQNVFFSFAEECTKKYRKKMEMKERIYSSEEMPVGIKAAFRVAIDDKLKSSILTKEAENVFGKDLYNILFYRLIH